MSRVRSSGYIRFVELEIEMMDSNTHRMLDLGPKMIDGWSIWVPALHGSVTMGVNLPIFHVF